MLKLVKQANLLFEEGKYVEAKAKYEKALQQLKSRARSDQQQIAYIQLCLANCNLLLCNISPTNEDEFEETIFRLNKIEDHLKETPCYGFKNGYCLKSDYTFSSVPLGLDHVARARTNTLINYGLHITDTIGPMSLAKCATVDKVIQYWRPLSTQFEKHHGLQGPYRQHYTNLLTNLTKLHERLLGDLFWQQAEASTEYAKQYDFYGLAEYEYNCAYAMQSKLNNSLQQLILAYKILLCNFQLAKIVREPNTKTVYYQYIVDYATRHSNFFNSGIPIQAKFYALLFAAHAALNNVSEKKFSAQKFRHLVSNVEQYEIIFAEEPAFFRTIYAEICAVVIPADSVPNPPLNGKHPLTLIESAAVVNPDDSNSPAKRTKFQYEPSPRTFRSEYDSLASFNPASPTNFLFWQISPLIPALDRSPSNGNHLQSDGLDVPYASPLPSPFQN